MCIMAHVTSSTVSSSFSLSYLSFFASLSLHSSLRLYPSLSSPLHLSLFISVVLPLLLPIAHHSPNPPSQPQSPGPAPPERRALSVVYAEDAEEYDEEMVAVCASLAGVSRDNVISVSTDFGPDGPLEDAGRRRRNLMTSRYAG